MKKKNNKNLNQYNSYLEILQDSIWEKNYDF